MGREIVDPTLDDLGDEQHPAFALIGASRVSHSPPGAVLFDSEIRHQHYVVVRLSVATRKRDLNRDWLHSKQAIVELAMSEAQWASFVSSMNVGSGVPCTLLFREKVDEPIVPGMPYAPRMEESMAEVRSAGDRSLAKVREAFEKYTEKKSADNLRSLQAAIENAPKNMAFAAESLSEHAENTVQKARADIEAMVLAKAEQLGLAEVDARQLLPGEE